MMFEDLEAWQQVRQLVNEIYSFRPFAVDRGTESQTPTSTVASAHPNLLSAGFHLPMTR